MIKSILFLFIFLLVSSCATNYQENCKHIKATVWKCD